MTAHEVAVDLGIRRVEILRQIVRLRNEIRVLESELEEVERCLEPLPLVRP